MKAAEEVKVFSPHVHSDADLAVRVSPLEPGIRKLGSLTFKQYRSLVSSVAHGSS